MQENNKTKFVFFGTPDVASKTLAILKNHNIIPSLIITSPDKPQGRNMLLTPTPVKTWAIENQIFHLEPEGTEELKDILESKKSEYDLFLVVAYGKIMPKEILDMPKLRSFNIHYSLLPKYRGASPVEGAILNGETKTGVSIQQMEYKMDSGPIVAMKEIDIRNEETTPELKDRLIEIGAQLFIETFPKIIENKISKVEQDHNKATYTKKITKEDGLVDIEKELAINLYNKFRAYYTWPRIYFMKNGKRVIITDATFENGIFQIKKVIPEGKKEVKYEDFLRQIQS